MYKPDRVFQGGQADLVKFEQNISFLRVNLRKSGTSRKSDVSSALEREDDLPKLKVVKNTHVSCAQQVVGVWHRWDGPRSVYERFFEIFKIFSLRWEQVRIDETYIVRETPLGGDPSTWIEKFNWSESDGTSVWKDPSAYWLVPMSSDNCSGLIKATR